MRKLLSIMTVIMVAVQLMAAPVDVTTARIKAQHYLMNKVYAGKFMTPGAADAKLIKTEMGENADAPVYYIFNTATTFVIVAGDDRAEEILAIGDRPLKLYDMPKNMQAWLDNYKQQLDWLLTHPDVKVDKPTAIKSPMLKGNQSIGPLLTALWYQAAPYNDQCHFTYNGTTYECYTGCAATSASMILYHWKYPTHQVGPIPSYTTTLDLGEYNSVTYTYPALPAVTFDWDNMIDDYTGDYTPAQAAAVATLMRYVGQKEHMMYGTEGSGIFTTDTQVIADMYISFGYDATTCRFVKKSDYSEEQWAQMVQEEIINHRPVVYCGVDVGGAGGHAFNVDGYDTSLNKYHVNFGWSGEGNSWCAMNAFSARSYTFSDNQRMVLGIQPPYGRIVANPEEVIFNGFAGETYTEVVKVNAVNIESNINVTLNGSELYSINATTITPQQAANGYDVTVTYSPTQAGSSDATLTLSCADDDVETVTVPISGTALPRVPTLLVEPNTLNFTTVASLPVSKTITLTGAFLPNDVTVTLNDENGVFTVSPTSISQSSTDAHTPVDVVVTFNSAAVGEYNATVTFSSNGAESKTVQLMGEILDGGTASDPYLNITKHETIDDAGWNTSDIQNLYRYTEYEDQDCAWLTVSNYGVMMANSMQEWFDNNISESYSTSWSATDIFLGDDSYFGSKPSYACDWNGLNQYFYVTNCTQVKQYAYNRSDTYPLIMRIYECSLNSDGSLTAGTTPIDTKQSSVYNTTEVITSSELNASKIYMVHIYNDYSYLYEIGFKTQLSSYPVPVAVAATEITNNSFVANWTPCEGADSYNLRVVPKNYDILTEGFSKCTKAGSIDIGNTLDNYMDNEGWTGSKVYEAIGGVRLGTGSSLGTLTSPGLTLTDNKVTVAFKAKAFNNDTNCSFKVSCGNASETVTVADNNEATYTVVLDCNAAAGQKIKFEATANGKRVVLTSIHIIDGEHAGVTRSIDFDGVIFTGITANSYKVLDLDPATTYFYDVKAVFGTKESPWTNLITVTTLAGGVYGDVDGDGEVTAVDITAIYNYLLNGDETYLATSDVDGDGEITTVDITVIYNILLGN